MTEKFGDVLQFCSHLSKLMVTEIRRRASNQSTGNKFIALSIWNFLYQLKFVKINFHWHFKNTHNNEETITSIFLIIGTLLWVEEFFTEAASCAIVSFLEMDSSETTGNGWLLLTALNLLSCGNQALIDCMTAASLPSTLVKCLYLFFDLPEIEEPDGYNPNADFPAEERRILLQKIFAQVNICFFVDLSIRQQLYVILTTDPCKCIIGFR